MNLKQYRGVWPSTPSEAWQSLRGNRWAKRLDLDEFAVRTDVDEISRSDAIMQAIDPEPVDREIADQEREAAQHEGERPPTDH